MEKSEANTAEAIIPRTENRTISRYFLAAASLNLFKKKKNHHVKVAFANALVFT